MQLPFRCHLVDLLYEARCAAVAPTYIPISAHFVLTFSMVGSAYLLRAHTGYYMLRMDATRHLSIDELMKE